MNVCQTELSEVTLGLFFNELWRFELGEHFHQNIHIMEECYLGWLDVSFLAKYLTSWNKITSNVIKINQSIKTLEL